MGSSSVVPICPGGGASIGVAVNQSYSAADSLKFSQVGVAAAGVRILPAAIYTYIINIIIRGIYFLTHLSRIMYIVYNIYIA